MLPLLPGRAPQLCTLFKQLIDNAVDALDESRVGPRELRVATLAGADHVQVVIEDSGPGVPDEWRFKVFEPFFTTKGADQHHLGMGLAIAQEVVPRRRARSTSRRRSRRCCARCTMASASSAAWSA